MLVEIKMYCSPLCPPPHEVRESTAITNETEREIRACVIADLLQMREDRKGSESHSKPEGNREEIESKLGVQTPTGYGLVLLPVESDRDENRPCRSDINPVYQSPMTNSSRKGTVK